MRTVSIEQVLACPALPSLPLVAVEMLRLTADENVRLAEIARVVQNDQALAAKILNTVNSSYYSLAAPCPNITRALTYMGLSTVKALVLGFSLVDCTRSANAFDHVKHWRRSMYAAAAARRLVSLMRTADPDEAFVAALMQDLGMPALSAALGAPYAEIIASVEGDHEQLPSAEMADLGFHHAEAGARLAERWRLPPSIIEVIRFHHDPADATEYPGLVRAAALGWRAAEMLTMSDASMALADLRRFAAEWFGLTGPQLNDLLSAVEADGRELAPLFQVDAGAARDINAILARAEEAALQHQVRMQRETESLRQTNSDLARMALIDGLTGASNRNFFDLELQRQFSQARSLNASLAVIMVDADQFKLLNDEHGHQAGDAVLAQIVRRMQAHAGETGLVCRYGGEEFAIILPGADRRSAAQVAEQVRRAIADAPVSLQHLHAPVDSVRVTVSVGVSVLEARSGAQIAAPQMLVQAADKALYAAKNAGRNCVRVFCPQAVGHAA